MGKEENKGKNIQGEARADVRQLVVKSNQKSDGYEAIVDLAIAGNEVASTKLFGEDFARLAFGQMTEVQGPEGPETVHLAKSISAGAQFRLAKHVIKLNGSEIVAKPEIKKIVPIDKSESVSTVLRLTVYVGADDGLGNSLIQMVGDTVPIEFSPAQQDLPGV